MNKWNIFFEHLKEELKEEYDTIVDNIEIYYDYTTIPFNNDISYISTTYTYPIIALTLRFTGEMSRYVIPHLDYIFSLKPIKIEHEFSYSDTYTIIKVSYAIHRKVQ